MLIGMNNLQIKMVIFLKNTPKLRDLQTPPTTLEWILTIFGRVPTSKEILKILFIGGCFDIFDFNKKYSQTTQNK